MIMCLLLLSLSASVRMGRVPRRDSQIYTLRHTYVRYIRDYGPARWLHPYHT